MSDKESITSLYEKAVGDGTPSSSDKKALSKLTAMMGNAVSEVYAGDKTINQIRAGLGLPPKKDGDRLPQIPEGSR